MARLSPTTSSRLTPLLDIPDPVLHGTSDLESHYFKRAKGISEAWSHARPLYVDMYNLPSQLRMASGMHPLRYVFDQLVRLGVRAIPVTGTEADRDSAYWHTAFSLIHELGTGFCLRLSREDLNVRKSLRSEITKVLEVAQCLPEHCDLLIDFRHVISKDLPELKTVSLEVLQIIQAIGEFRNVAIAGGSIPEQMGKKHKRVVHHEKRNELDLWSGLLSAMPLAYADYGVITPNYVPPKGFVRAPSRIRYTTESEHIFRRAARKDYVALCRELIATSEFKGRLYSFDDHLIYGSAKGAIRLNQPGQWVLADTNHHLTLVSAQIFDVLHSKNLANRFQTPEPVAHPWLQPDLLTEST
ncbi:MAG: beta family protein [Burkholderiales bacterium]